MTKQYYCPHLSACPSHLLFVCDYVCFIFCLYVHLYHLVPICVSLLSVLSFVCLYDCSRLISFLFFCLCVCFFACILVGLVSCLSFLSVLMSVSMFVHLIYHQSLCLSVLSVSSPVCPPLSSFC